MIARALAVLGFVLLLSQMDWPVTAQDAAYRAEWLKERANPVLVQSGEYNVAIGPYAGAALTDQSHLTHIGRDTVVSWRNKGNGPDRWTPIVLYVWFEGEGGIMVNRRTGHVKRCGPPDAAMVTCLPVEPTP